ncbi:hypothetical protein ILUMI_14347 [Ignelater luminosus]|uniref:Uncharacterized protein n=1 Tax=Ignelater luminosus TaxID=2038154 RepID=A0A8K0GAJ8_IGNLU|nr:hypothetical protein ILUMI_14347 [Ignelater luminosus]
MNLQRTVTLWENPRPSSTRFCRPIKFMYMKETTESIRKEVVKVRDEVAKLNPYEIHINDKLVPINFVLHLTMVDGKVINALTESSSQSCHICKCKPPSKH